MFVQNNKAVFACLSSKNSLNRLRHEKISIINITINQYDIIIPQNRARRLK
nr:MAG TPA: hypothetical protein [Inoviridae sp.]